MRIKKGALPINMWYFIIVEFFAKRINANGALIILTEYGFDISYRTMLTVFKYIRKAIVCFVKNQYTE